MPGSYYAEEITVSSSTRERGLRSLPGLDIPLSQRVSSLLELAADQSPQELTGLSSPRLELPTETRLPRSPSVAHSRDASTSASHLELPTDTRLPRSPSLTHSGDASTSASEEPSTTTSREPSTVASREWDDAAQSEISLAIAMAHGGEVEKLVNIFNKQCQKRNLKPVFDMLWHQSGRFVGTLDVDGKRIHCDQPQSSKKALKNWLAIAGLMQIGTADPVPQVKPENWIGLLTEFLKSLQHRPEAEWVFEGGDQGPFLCTVSVTLHINDNTELFRYQTDSAFGRKQMAKNAAAKAAVLAFARSGLMRLDGHYSEDVTTFPTVPEALLGSSAKASGTPLNECQRIAKLTTKYQLPPPRYDLKALDPGCPFYSGSAFFPRSLLAGRENFETGGPIGRVNHIFGYKNAKAELAKQVLPILKSWIEATSGQSLPNDD